jgi:hypothetical protein
MSRACDPALGESCPRKTVQALGRDSAVVGPWLRLRIIGFGSVRFGSLDGGDWTVSTV